MAKITIANCKAPTVDEFPKLTKLRVEAIFDEAAEIKREIHQLEEKLRKVQAKAQAKLELALPGDVISVRYGSLLVTRRKGYERRSLDKEWAVRKLVALKVSKQEIDEHTEVSTIEPGVSFQLLDEA